MKSEPDLTCPRCGNTMELLTANEAGFTRVCRVWATLAWECKDGTIQVREAHEVTGEEKREILENSQSVTAEDELARLRRSKKPS